MTKKSVLLFYILLFALTRLSGQDIDLKKYGIETSGTHVPAGLKEGDKAPEFSAYDQTGKRVELSKLLEKGPVVVFFYRGNWCPACNKQLSNIEDSVNLITSQGFSVVAITPESIEYVEETVKAHNLTFTVLYDCQEKIMQDYDVMFTVTKEFCDLVKDKLKVDLTEHNGHQPAHLPVTATYIINKAGYITAVHFNPDYHIRASAGWILKKLGSAL